MEEERGEWGAPRSRAPSAGGGQHSARASCGHVGAPNSSGYVSQFFRSSWKSRMMCEISWFFSTRNQLILEISRMKHVYRPPTASGRVLRSPTVPQFSHLEQTPLFITSCRLGPWPPPPLLQMSSVTLSTSHCSPARHWHSSFLLMVLPASWPRRRHSG